MKNFILVLGIILFFCKILFKQDNFDSNVDLYVYNKTSQDLKVQLYP